MSKLRFGNEEGSSSLVIEHENGAPALTVKSTDLIHKATEVADRDALKARVDNVEGEAVWQADIGLMYVWTDTQGVHNGGTIINVGTGSWIASYSGAVNVKWFGADSTGAVDSKDALLAMASSLNDGDHIDLGDGLLTSSVQIPFTNNNITLFGSATIKALNTISGGLFNFTDINNVTIRDLTFTIDGANNASLLYFRPNVDLENVLIENCTFNFTGYQAINHAGAGFSVSNFIVDKCKFYGDSSAVAIWYEFGALSFSRGYTPLIVSECYFDNCSTSLQTNGTGLIKDTRFINNKLYNCSGRPIFIYHSVDSFINGNTFDTYVDAAWFEQKCIITDNLFRNSENDGVILYNADKVFLGNSVYNNGGNGLILSVELRNCLIEGNNIYQNDGNGIRVSAEPRGASWTGGSRIYDIALKSNQIVSNGLHGIYLDDINANGTFGNGIEEMSIIGNTIRRNGVIDRARETPLNDTCGIYLEEFGENTVGSRYKIISNDIELSTSPTGVRGNQYNALYFNDNTSSTEKSYFVMNNVLRANPAGIAFKNNRRYGVKSIMNNFTTGLVDPSSSGISTVSGNFNSAKSRTVSSTFEGITVGWGSAAPTSGTYDIGSIVYDRLPQAGANVGWVCTETGTPGTWKTFGTIEA